MIKLFHKNCESTTVPLRKLRKKEELEEPKTSKSFIGMLALNLIRCFEEEGSLEDRPWSGRLALRVGRVHVVQSVREDLAAKTGSSIAPEDEKRTGISEPPIRCILHEMLELYPYKMQTLHQLLTADTSAR